LQICNTDDPRLGQRGAMDVLGKCRIPSRTELRNWWDRGAHRQR
jgi:hypothetical protein